MSSSMLFSALAFAVCAGSVSASSFLSRAQGEDTATIDTELQSTIMQKIEEMLGREDAVAEGRLVRIEDYLRATFKAMPKNEDGKLEHAAVRYTLHGYFVQRHGWYVRGLSDVGEGFNSTSSNGALQDRVEEFVQGVFEQKLGAHGLNLREMALLAATFENLVHQETAERLGSTLKILNMSDVDEFTVAQTNEVLEAYMMSYIVRVDFAKVRPAAIHILRERIYKVYPTWDETRSFLHDVRAQSGQHRSYFTPSDIEDVLEQVHDQYGRWQDTECQDLKSKLLALEDMSIGFNGSGRVRMADFYGSVKDGNWQFRETREFLDQLGALDVHDPNVPRVIIPNYINSPTNCLAGSKYYSVCCINECEDLIDSIEHRFKSPSAYPSEVNDFVASLGSSTVPAGRTLQPILVARLDEIASHHGGVVPLHGRLFSQWMHHAYPRECPYPHMSGTTKPQRVGDYKMETKLSATHEDDGLHEEVKTLTQMSQASSEAEGSDECTMWSHQEELYVNGALDDHERRGRFRLFAYASVIIAAALMLGQKVWSCTESLTPSSGRKEVVFV